MAGSESLFWYDSGMAKFVLAVLFIFSVEVHAQSWKERATVYTTTHWIVRTDLPSEHAVDAGRLFDAVYEAYRNGLSMLPEQRDVKLEAWVFQNRGDYLGTVSSFGASPENSGGMFISAIGITAVDVSGSWRTFESTAKHEAFHQFASSRFAKGIPTWLNEGLAEYFENTVYINGSIINGQVSNSTLQALQNDIQTNSCIRFLELMRMSQKTWNQNLVDGNGAKQYRQAWAMVHFLVHSNNGQYASSFDRYLLLIAKGVNHEEAFVSAFKTDDLESFERAWATYINNLKPSSSKLAAHRLNFLAAGAKECLKRERKVSSLKGLYASLQTIGFKTTLSVNYEEQAFDANDQSNYAVPPDSFSAKPEFIYKANTPLPSIYTTGLEPFNLYVKWFRKNGNLSWTIEVGN